MSTFSSQSINQGIVYKKSTGNFAVYADGRMVPCSLSTRLKKQVDGASYPNSARRSKRDSKPMPAVDTLAVGDEVCFVQAQDGTGTIVEVLPRRNRFSRRSAVPMPSAHAIEQVIAANIEQVVPVFSAANPAPKWNMLDRYLVSAESLNLPVLISITKLDLVQAEGKAADEEFLEAVEEYRRIGYPVALVSSVTGEGVEELRTALQGRISVFLGKSGVGKTSLLNALQPGLGLRVNEVSQVTGKGKHTTTHLEMFPLEVGGAIIDTPGVREFGLWDVDEDDLALFFPEMQPFVGQCKFGLDCQHDEEPGCAIRSAVSEGQISPRRYYSYLRLKVET